MNSSAEMVMQSHTAPYPDTVPSRILHLKEGGRVVFTLPHPNILVTSLFCRASEIDLEQQFKLRADFLAETGDPNRRMIEIRDYAGFVGHADKRQRTLNLKFWHETGDRVDGLFVASAKPFMAATWHLGYRFLGLPFPFFTTSTVQEALDKALKMVKSPSRIEPLPAPADTAAHFSTQPNWCFAENGFELIISVCGNMVLIKGIGTLLPEHESHIYRCYGQIFAEKAVPSDCFYRIIDYSEVDGASSLYRSAYLNAVEKVHSELNISAVSSYAFGGSRLLRTAFRLGGIVLGKKITFVSNLAEAVQIIRQNRGSGSVEEPGRIKEQVDQALRFIATFSWNSGDEISEFSEMLADSGPLHELFEALVLVKEDVQELLRQQKSANEILEQRVAERTRDLEIRTAELQSANEKLRELDSVKSDFVSTISHELRTPLTSVLGFAKMIKKKNEQILFPALDQNDEKIGKTKEQVQDNLEIIISEGERLTNLINDVLDIAKMESGKVEWKMDPVVPESIAVRAAAALSSLFKAKSLPCRFEIEPNLPLLSADEDRLIQVMINLLSNAVKFTDSGEVLCRVLRAGESVRFCVEDTGDGIAPENHTAVFEKFRQVGNVLSDKPKGTGLGLPICREIVEHHGGKIWVESELGAGSRFYFDIPVPQSSAVLPQQIIEKQNIHSHTELVPEISHCRIVAADDEITNRMFIQYHLEDAGYTVFTAENGLEAVSKTMENLPDLVVLDVVMPHMDGFAAAQLLRAAPETKHIPIVMVSSRDESRQVQELGIDGYLTKPVDGQTLIALIEDILDKSARRQL